MGKSWDSYQAIPQWNKASWLERWCVSVREKYSQLGGGSLKSGAYKVCPMQSSFSFFFFLIVAYKSFYENCCQMVFWKKMVRKTYFLPSVQAWVSGGEILLGWISQVSTPRGTPQNQALPASPDSLQPVWESGLAWTPRGSFFSIGRGCRDPPPTLGVRGHSLVAMGRS